MTAKKKAAAAKPIALDFEVHSAARSSVQEDIEGPDGKMRTGTFPVLTVELVGHGSAFSLHFHDAEEAEALFKVGKKITMTLAGAK